MDHRDLRQKMLSEKGFLHAIYVDSAARSFRDVTHNIRTATEHQLNLLIRILQKIANKKIAIPDVKKLIKSKREPLISKLSNETLTEKLLAAEHGQKIEFLLQFTPLYGVLLYYLFVKLEKK